MLLMLPFLPHVGTQNMSYTMLPKPLDHVEPLHRCRPWIS